MNKDRQVFICGGNGMIGQAQQRYFRAAGFNAVMDTDIKLDLLDQASVFKYFQQQKPGYVFINSIKVGGILVNSKFPADFIYLNTVSQANVIQAAHHNDVKKLLYLGSSCIYPKACPQPMKEEYLLTGPLEPTSEPYALSKISGIRMVQAFQKQYGVDFIAAVPADAYGPGDDFNPETGHVLAALFSRTTRAKKEKAPEVVVWGTGKPRRETLFVDDLADACAYLMENYNGPDFVNIGGGTDIAIADMANVIKDVVGYEGKISFDTSRPDGMPRKLLDTGRMEKLGWKPKTGLADGLKQTYHWYKSQRTTMGAEI